MRARPGLLLALLVGVAMAPLADAEAPQFRIVPDRDLAGGLDVAPGQVVRLNFTAENLGSDTVGLALDTDAPQGWNATILPAGFDLPNGSSGEVRRFTLSVQVPEAAKVATYPIAIEAVAVGPGGEATRLEVPVQLRITHVALVLGMWANPLPAPLDNPYGVFLLDLVFWAVIAGAIILLQDPIVRWLTRRAERSVSARIVRDLRKPMFMALVFLGITQAWQALPPSWWVEVGHRILAALTILVGMYVVYKVFRAALTYYIENVSAKTESTLDDILVPVLEKVGAVVIVVAGLLYFIGSLGIELGTFIAGGVVVSMVLAFAAQDTLSNFFAGLFLMLDRPFGRGDDIMLVSGGPIAGDIFRVDHVGLRSTRLYHYKNHQLVVMPNNELAKNPVVNLMYPDLRWRVHLPLTVTYGANVDQVQALLEGCARDHPMVDTSPGFEPFASLEGFHENGMHFVLLFLVRDVKKRARTASDVREAILKAFGANGITLAFPQREVRIVVTPESADAAGGSNGNAQVAGTLLRRASPGAAAPPAGQGPEPPKRS